jgi:hypothetical protein
MSRHEAEAELALSEILEAQGTLLGDERKEVRARDNALKNFRKASLEDQARLVIDHMPSEISDIERNEATPEFQQAQPFSWGDASADAANPQIEALVYKKSKRELLDLLIQYVDALVTDLKGKLGGADEAREKAKVGSAERNEDRRRSREGEFDTQLPYSMTDSVPLASQEHRQHKGLLTSQIKKLEAALVELREVDFSEDHPFSSSFLWGYDVLDEEEEIESASASRGQSQTREAEKPAEGDDDARRKRARRSTSSSGGLFDGSQGSAADRNSSRASTQQTDKGNDLSLENSLHT